MERTIKLKGEFTLNTKKWRDVRHRILSKWSRLRSSDVDVMRKDIKALPECLRISYGYSEAIAQAESDRFIDHLPPGWSKKIESGAEYIALK